MKTVKVIESKKSLSPAASRATRAEQLFEELEKLRERIPGRFSRHEIREMIEEGRQIDERNLP